MQGALINQVFKADPLCCPKCGAEMKIISFIERRQSEVIQKLRCAKRTSFVWATDSQGLGSPFSGIAGCACLPKLQRRQGRKLRPAPRRRSKRRWQGEAA